MQAGYPMHMSKPYYLCLLAAIALALMTPAFAQSPIEIPLIASRWTADTETQFTAREGFPQGLMVMKAPSENGGALLQGLDFGSGTIEFDMKPIGEDMPGIIFHRRDTATAEELYVRVSPNCPASQDCLQYTPRFQGRMLWDTYIQYQHAAPVRSADWNHFKLVISGKRLIVFVNGSATASLSVDELQGEDSHGALQLQGPAMFANLVVTPGAVDGLSPQPLPDPTRADTRYLTSWQVTAPALLADGAVVAGAIPGPSAPWQTIHAERGGLVNLARRFINTHKQPPLVAWLKTSVLSDRAQSKRVSLGFLRVASVFINGTAVFSGKNNYNVPGGRRMPDGRLGLQNASFDLPLQKGKNTVVVALRSNTPDMRDQYGFGLMFRFDDALGIHRQR